VSQCAGHWNVNSHNSVSISFGTVQAISTSTVTQSHTNITYSLHFTWTVTTPVVLTIRADINIQTIFILVSVRVQMFLDYEPMPFIVLCISSSLRLTDRRPVLCCICVLFLTPAKCPVSFCRCSNSHITATASCCNPHSSQYFVFRQKINVETCEGISWWRCATFVFGPLFYVTNINVAWQTLQCP
jgi:hypothetical protein